MANEIKTRDAIQSLKPNAEWTLTGSSLNWLDSEQTEPTADELAAEVIRLFMSNMTDYEAGQLVAVVTQLKRASI